MVLKLYHYTVSLTGNRCQMSGFLLQNSIYPDFKIMCNKVLRYKYQEIEQNVETNKCS